MNQPSRAPSSDSMPKSASNARPKVWPWLLTAGLVLALDQFSKWLITQDLPLYAGRPITGFFNLVHIENPGAAFSFLAGAAGWQRWLFTVLGLAASALIVWLLFRHRGKTLFSLALALILGGALGNVADRLVWGHVTDFLDFYITVGGQQWHWPAFNLADSSIFVGAVLLLLDEWRQSRKRKGDAG
ncbi:prolipoprotein signal peptidase (signal peptidase II) [Thiomonas sp. X19]|nr:prolipoprotein signal peptidase (signal peptidase II) [Thiomonas sp. X19]